jgi:hypothetical protein
VKFLSRVCILLLTLSVTACFNPASTPTDAPANASLDQVGDGLVVLNWDAVAGRKYWIFYNTGTDVSLNNYSRILLDARPPYVLTGLTNGTQYAFSITSSENGSAVGPFTPVFTATPRLISPSTPWTIGTSLSSNNLNSIVLGVSTVANATNTGIISTYVTVGDAATIFYGTYSYPDVGGVTGWTQATGLPISTSTNLKSVIYDGTRFIALGDDGSVIRSTDYTGVTWESAAAITSTSVMNSMTVGASRYVAVGDGGEIYLNTSAGASAGSTWTKENSGTSNNLYKVAYVNSKFIAVGASGTILTSPDGATWTTQTSNLNDDLYGVAYGASKTTTTAVGGGISVTTNPGSYTVVGNSGAVASSPDAINWTAESNTISNGESFRSICYGPDQQFIAVGTNGLVAYSSTGLDGSWATSQEGSQDLNSISPNYLFIATGAAGANISVK